MTLLGVNIDHVATLRNARGGRVPDPIEAALIAEAHGADGITAHLREDRRHIRDEDIRALKARIKTRLNMEMANTDEMVGIALDVKPYMVTLVPERRQELTTEGGLDVVTHRDALKRNIQKLHDAGIKVSLFIDPDLAQVYASQEVGARIVEFHTGAYCETFGQPENAEKLSLLMEASKKAVELGIEVNAGHGLNYENVKPILSLPGLNELNIGHSIVSQAVFIGIGPAVRKMKDLLVS
ncbi:MAG TPA: pyridoxine 5'-phosphate synthase [Oculatellaceae cyanobacterium]|jgi:pyridoxine 5-phosphate synthase